jgi:hypothetical protein
MGTLDWAPQGGDPLKDRPSRDSALPITEAISVGGITKEADTESEGALAPPGQLMIIQCEGPV